MSLGIWQLVIILAIVLLLFGRGRIAGVMGDFGKGIRSLREGLKGDEEKKDETPKKVTDEKSNDSTS